MQRLERHIDLSPNPTLRPCHCISPSDETHFNRVLLNNDMGILIAEEDIPKGPDGQLLVGGWFCVDHSKGRLRLIFDRLPQNATEETLQWHDLPSGCQLAHLKLEPWETMRGSGDDLECWYYCLRHREDWYSKNAAGRRIRGGDFTDFGTAPGRNYRFCLTVVAMGDTNGLFLAQESHEAILHSGGCLRPEHTLRHSRATPNAAVGELAYVDDHYVSQRLPYSYIVYRISYFPLRR